MGCSSCGGGHINSNRQVVNPETYIPCEYDIITLQGWLLTLYTIRDTGQVINVGLTYPKMNSYIGYVQSAINTYMNPCFFKIQLDEIASFINGL